MLKARRQRMVVGHLPLAHAIAGKFTRRSLPQPLDAADLRQEAALGLVQAGIYFSGRKGVEFGAYARQRVAGRIRDAFREADHMSRWYRKKAKRGEAMEIPAPVSLQPWMDGSVSAEPSPEQQAAAAERRVRVECAVGMLPARLRVIVRAYYYQELTQEEIGKRLGVTQGRISQLRARALRMMREGMEAEWAA